MTHAGHSYALDEPARVRDVAEAERAASVSSAASLRALGHACPIVSTGSTPTVLFAEHLRGVTEARAGIHLFNDLAQLSRGVCTEADIAVSVRRAAARCGAGSSSARPRRWPPAPRAGAAGSKRTLRIGQRARGRKADT